MSDAEEAVNAKDYKMCSEKAKKVCEIEYGLLCDLRLR